VGKNVCPIGSARASRASDFAHVFIRRMAGTKTMAAARKYLVEYYQGDGAP